MHCLYTDMPIWRIVKVPCLGKDFSDSVEEEGEVIDPMELCSECFQFGIQGFGSRIG